MYWLTQTFCSIGFNLQEKRDELLNILGAQTPGTGVQSSKFYEYVDMTKYCATDQYMKMWDRCGYWIARAFSRNPAVMTYYSANQVVREYSAAVARQNRRPWLSLVGSLIGWNWIWIELFVFSVQLIFD